MAVRLAALLPWRVAQALYGHGSAPIVDPSREVASRASILTESPPAHAAGFFVSEPHPCDSFPEHGPLCNDSYPSTWASRPMTAAAIAARRHVQGQRELRQGDDGHGRRGDRRGADQRARGLRARYRRALPAVQKNRPGGVAPLDADGKVPAGNLPDSVPMSQKGAAGGVAPLDAAGKVPAGHLPDSIPMSQKGAADGVTPWTPPARCRSPTCRSWTTCR